MKITQKPIDPIGAQLVESNNQHEDRLDALSKKLTEMSIEMQRLKDKIQRHEISNF